MSAGSLFAAPTFDAPPATEFQAAAQDGDHGFRRTYTVQADSAWLSPGRVLSPAFITLAKGSIVRISSEPPRETKTLLGGTKKPKVIKVSGNLASGMVDAWSGIQLREIAQDRHPMAFARMADSLPADLPGGDLELASRIAAARTSGTSVIYLGRHDGQLQRGVGQAAFFSANDLPVLAGKEWLDLSAAGGGLSIQRRATELRSLFASADEWRESLEDFQEKMEKYEESLEKYQKDLDKFIEENKETDEKESAKADDPKKADDKEKDKRPKRPKRPSAPARNAARSIVLDAIDGKLGVRILAQDSLAIRAALDLQAEHDFNLLLVGADQASDFRFELADAGIGVVLDVHDVFQTGPGESLLDRYQGLLEAGVDVALSSGGRASSSMLLTAAGELIAQGADADQVWASLTTVPAQLLGLQATHGRIQRGASGSLILFEGSSPFDASAVFRTHKPK